MATITRDDLRRMKTENVIRKKEKKIKYYVNYIKDKIIERNDDGDIIYFFNFDAQSKKETEELGTEIVARLQEIFIDMEITYRQASGTYDTHIEFDWS
jgi:hypothetical protein